MNKTTSKFFTVLFQTLFSVSIHSYLSEPTEPPFMSTVNSSPSHRLPQDNCREMKSYLCISLSFSVCGPSSATISTGQVQAVPRCSSQRPGQRAAEEEEKSGATQHQDSAPYRCEDTIAHDINIT